MVGICDKEGLILVSHEKQDPAQKIHLFAFSKVGIDTDRGKNCLRGAKPIHFYTVTTSNTVACNWPNFPSDFLLFYWKPKEIYSFLRQVLCNIGGSLNKFPDFVRMGTFIDSTHMKL